jgi:16S rRNA (cytosine967-C5)-methyltransferase
VSRAGSQERTLLGILALVRPHWRSDRALPSRIDKILAGDRRLGSRDRRLYRELVYTALRYLPWIEPLLEPDPPGAVRRIAWLAPETPAVQGFRDEITAGMPACPSDVHGRAQLLGCDDGELTPSWLKTECPAAADLPLRDILLTRAPLWLRLQTHRPQTVFGEFGELGLKWRPCDLVDGALELPAGTDIARTDAYATGMVEVQDIGSQLVLHTAAVPEAGHWLDACAGAGGKTLQLAAMLGPGGHVTARDIRRFALEELSKRAFRSGVGSRISIGQETDPANGFDGVLVDAPCSGSGTLRRAPHLRWTSTEAAISSASELQQRLLSENSARVRVGGLLVYATCSLCVSENESVTKLFRAGNPGFRPVIPDTRLLPPAHDGDAFFVASFRREA